MDQLINQAADLLRRSQSVVFFTGAGMSKESGVPTFRDALDGLWAKYQPEDLATPEAFRKDPQRVRGFYNDRRERLRSCKPNAGHFAVAELEDHLSNVVVVTQNVDGFHEAAGSTNVIALHGQIMEDRCHLGCEGKSPAVQHGSICPKCGQDSMRPNVVWFGEPPDPYQMIRGAAAIMTADAFVIVGTSGLVDPAASLAEMAIQTGRPTIEVNPERSAFSDHVPLFLPYPAATAIPGIVRAGFGGWKN